MDADQDGEAMNGATIDNDDFFGDQSSDALEQESSQREVEVLRRQHMTSGIRDGASVAHDQHLQQGFDEGFAEGAKASAEAGFILGACTLLQAFFQKGTAGTRATHRSQALGDTEVMSQDVRDIEQAGARLQTELRDLPENGSISVERAKEACRKVAVFDVPPAALPDAESNSAMEANASS